MGVMDKVCIENCCLSCLLQKGRFHRDCICSTLIVAGIVTSADSLMVLDVADQAKNARIRQYW